MLFAQVVLPEAIRRDIFIKLAQRFRCIEEDKNSRVFEDDDCFSEGTNVHKMTKKGVYIDECELKDDEYYKDGEKVDSFHVYKRPTKDYAVLAVRNVVIDLEEFCSIAPNIGFEVIKSCVA